MEKCMLAQGFRKVSVNQVAKPTQADARWKVLEDDWDASVARRQALSTDPALRGADSVRSEEIKEEIRALNNRIRELERRLSYAPSQPVQVD